LTAVRAFSWRFRVRPANGDLVMVDVPDPDSII
jgi:hypothetical protein